MYQVPGFDLAGAIMSAQQARATEEQTKLLSVQRLAAEQQGELARLLPEAYAGYAAGRPQMLREIAPDRYADFEKNRAETAKGQMELAKSQVDVASKLAENNRAEAQNATARALKTSQVIVQAIDSLKKNPAMYPQLKVYLENLAKSGTIDALPLPEQMPAPDTIGQIRQVHLTNIQALQDPKTTDTMADVATQCGLDLRDPATRSDPRFSAGMKKYMQAKSEHGKVTVNIDNGQSQLEKNVISAAQTEIKDAEKGMARLDRLKALGDPSQYLGFGNQLKNGMNSFLARINPELLSEDEREKIKNMRLFREEIEQIGADYRHLISGAAVSDKEFLRLQQAVMNSDMSSPEFEASMKAMRKRYEEVIGINQKLLAAGVPVGTPEYRKRFQEEWRSRNLQDAADSSSAQPNTQQEAARPHTSDDAALAARLRELSSSGMSKEGAIMKAASEGLLAPERAQNLIRKLRANAG